MPKKNKYFFKKNESNINFIIKLCPRISWSWNFRQASTAVEVDEDKEIQEEGCISHRSATALQKVRHCFNNFPLAERNYIFERYCELLLKKRNMGLCGPYARLTWSLRGFPGSISIQFKLIIRIVITW